MMSLDPTPSNACPAWDDLKAWVDRELEATRQTTLGTHVETCAACQEEARLMRQIGTALRELEHSVEPSAELRGRILNRITEPSRRAWWSLPGNPFAMLRWVTVATAILVVGVVGRQAVVTQPTPQVTYGPAASAPPTAASPASPRESAKQEQRSAKMAAGAEKGTAPAGAPAMDAASNTVQLAPEASAQRAMPSKAAPGEAPAGGAAAMGGPSPIPAAPSTSVAAEPEWASQPRARRTYGGPQVADRLTPGRVSPDDVNRYTRGKALEEVKRKVVRRADLAVRTRSPLESVQKEIQTRLEKDDGFVESSHLTVPAGTERTARMLLRVPVGKLDEYLAWLGGLGEVQAKSVRGEDVTGTWVDQRAEVRELRKEEERLLETYRTHRGRERREEARRLLLHLRPRIAVAEERFALTGKLAALSTLTLTLIEPEQVRVQGSLWQDLDRTTRSAVASFMVALRVPAAILIWLVVFSPLWVPCVFLYRWATRKAKDWTYH